VEIWHNIPISSEEAVMMYDHYRAVILLYRTYKILASILYVKLVPDAEEITENTKETSKGEGQLFIKFLL